MSTLQRYQMFIDGKWVDAADGRTFTSLNPSTGEDWSEIPEATAADVDRAVNAAHRAFTEGEWAAALPTARGRYLRRLGDLLAQQSEDLGRIETIDTGKMLKETRWQAKYIAEFFHFYAGAADKVMGSTLPIDKPDMLAMTLREPLGVVAAVVPWNSQLFLVAVKIGPALAAGNTVVLKASEHASAPMLEFARLMEEAGFPPGVFNVVTGHGDPCGRVLTSHPLVQRISFTGGPESARHIIRNSAENFAQVSLELGGKSPFLVFEDADLESAVNGSICRHLRRHRPVLRGGLAALPAGEDSGRVPGHDGLPRPPDPHRRSAAGGNPDGPARHPGPARPHREGSGLRAGAGRASF